MNPIDVYFKHGISISSKTHFLKTWKDYFQMVWDEKKPFELRKNDRDYQVGDHLILGEYDEKQDAFLSRKISALVTSVVQNIPDFGLKDGYCIMGLAIVDRFEEEQNEV